MIFRTFFFSPTRSKSHFRVTNAVWSHSRLVEATILSSEYKITYRALSPFYIRHRLLLHALVVRLAGCVASSSLLLSLSSPPPPSTIRDSQWRTTAYTTTLKMVVDRGSPCVTPLCLRKGYP